MRPRSSRSNDLARSNDPARVAGPRMRDVAIVLAAGTLDGLLVLSVLGQAIALPVAFALHAGATMLASIAMLHGARDTTFALLSGLAMMLAGPAGGLIAILQMAALHLMPYSHRDNQAWLRMLAGSNEPDQAEALYEAIAHGRSFRPGPAPKSYAAIMTRGTVAERQDVLGQIVRGHRNYPPALLRAGLTSPDLAVRASAAAVYAKLRANEADKAATASRVPS